MNNLIIYDVPYTKTRLGRPNDGGYVVSDLPGEYDAIISGGVGGDVSFEQALLDRYPVFCAAFDGTVDKLPVQDNRISFVRKNLGAVECAATTNLRMFMEPFSNLFLKVDVEGHEFRVIPALSEPYMLKVKQLVLEIHTPADIQLYPTYYAGLADVSTSGHLFRLLEQVNRTHTLVHVHPNNACATNTVDGVLLPNVFECTFVRNDFAGIKTPNCLPIPRAIDMPNIANHPVLQFNHFPFVHQPLKVGGFFAKKP